MKLTHHMKKQMAEVYYKTSEIGKIGMKVPDTEFEVSTELPEYKKGYHPTKCLHKKFTSFYEGTCRVKFDRKTIPKSGKSIIGTCFVETKNETCNIYDSKTRALLGICKETNKEYYCKLWGEQFNARRI